MCRAGFPLKISIPISWGTWKWLGGKIFLPKPINKLTKEKIDQALQHLLSDWSTINEVCSIWVSFENFILDILSIFWAYLCPMFSQFSLSVESRGIYGHLFYLIFGRGSKRNGLGNICHVLQKTTWQVIDIYRCYSRVVKIIL